MTAPRRVLPGRTYLLTRRCLERRFYLRPDPTVTKIFNYLLAIACERYGIQLHAYVMMSNHYHLLVTDQYGTLPSFQQYFNSLLARAINQHRKHWGAFWDYESYSAVDLLEHDAIFTKLAYTELNPVRAGLVGRAIDWSGPTSASLRFGHKLRVERPAKFFSDKMPDKVTLELVEPPHVDRQPAQDKRDRAIADGQQVARRTQPHPLGMRGVLDRDWKDSPSSPEARRKLRPRFASRFEAVRVGALREYRRWLDAYKVALQRFRDGERLVEFPAGTYWMCARLACPQAPP